MSLNDVFDFEFPTIPSFGKRKADSISNGKWNVLDLFAGCGGFSFGFENTEGFTIVAANELDGTIAKTYQKNFPGVNMVVGDLSQEDTKNKVLEYFSEDTPCDLIIGSPPCQAYQDYFEMVDRLKPKMFVMDADPEVLTAKTPDDKRVLTKLRSKCFSVGYDWSYETLNCARYGVPQKRERVIFIGVQKAFTSSIYFPLLTHIEHRYVSVKRVLDNLKDKPNDEELSHIIPQHDEETKKKISEVESGDTKSGNSYRLDPWEPCETITPCPIHYEKDRLLTARECARIQTFPDNFLFEGSQTQVYQQIGNAVPPLFAECIAKTVKGMLEKIKEEEETIESSDDESTDSHYSSSIIAGEELKSSKAIRDPPIRPLKKQRKSSLCFEPICPITHEIMKDPVIAGDGFTYERKAIEEHFNRQGGKSPMTRQDIGINLIRNRGIKDAIDHYHEQKKKDSYLYDIPDNGCLQNREVYFDVILNRILYKDNKLPVTSDNVHVTYPNGKSYIGNVKNGQKEGHGVYTSASGDKYEGEYKNDEKEGHGVYTWADGDKYDGQWKNGLFEGHGVETYANGDKYEGEYKNDEKEGHGVYTWADGNKYDGQWKNGLFEGHGVYTGADGNKYDGEWKNDQKEGHGVETYTDGNKYDGEFKNDKKEGHGVETYTDGNKYDGEFKNDKREGHGVFTWANGNKYDGEFKNDRREGHGVLTNINGDKYDGEFKNGRREGHGVLTNINGDKYDGKFKDGNPCLDF